MSQQQFEFRDFDPADVVDTAEADPGAVGRIFQDLLHEFAPDRFKRFDDLELNERELVIFALLTLHRRMSEEGSLWVRSG